jgi:phosphatidate cytidylyltransferase
MLKVRVATGVVAIPLIVLLVWTGDRWFTAAVAAILFAATLEFQSAHGAWLRPLALIAAAFSAALAGTAHAGGEWMSWFLIGAIVIPLIWVTLFSETTEALPDWLWAVGGVLYLGWLGSHLVLLRDLGDGRDWVYLAVFSTFACDTAAYFVGRAIGRHHLAPAISPGKTVEGAVGGLVCGAAAVILLNYFLGLRLEAALIIPLALLLPLAAQIGDLAESKLKRSMEIKDASPLLPGHGGLMDRLDSVLLTTIVVYYYVRWVVL